MRSLTTHGILVAGRACCEPRARIGLSPFIGSNPEPSHAGPDTLPSTSLSLRSDSSRALALQLACICCSSRGGAWTMAARASPFGAWVKGSWLLETLRMTRVRGGALLLHLLCQHSKHHSQTGHVSFSKWRPANLVSSEDVPCQSCPYVLLHDPPLFSQLTFWLG